MKKFLIIIFVLGVIAVGAYFGVQQFKKSQSNKPTACTMEAKLCPDGSSVGRTGPLCEFEACPTVTQACYQYHQLATSGEPYSVDEELKITTAGDLVTGTKTGTQVGPDMTNGYEGTITGTQVGDTITAIFAYIIEGSSNNEQEEYQFRNQALVKHRYPLVDKNGILVPDKTGNKKDMIYNRVTCNQSVI